MIEFFPARISLLSGRGLRWSLGVLSLVAMLYVPTALVGAQETTPDAKQPETTAPEAGSPEPGTPKTPGPQAKAGEREGTMTLERMDEIIKRLDEKARGPRPGFWQFEIAKRTVMIVTDPVNDRMRIMVPIRPSEDISEDLMKRLMQANFDTALDSRYAVARDILWATFIHPLKALHDRQFVEAIGQTVNLAATFGTTFSSGLLSFGGGDSRGIIERQLIDGLLEKGLPI